MWVEGGKENTQRILANLDREIEQLNRRLLELDQDSEDGHLSEKAELWAGSILAGGKIGKIFGKMKVI